MSLAILQDFRRINIGLDVQLPHEQVILVSLGLGFWTVLIVFGAKFGGPDED